jgi:hypothetical protein
MKIVRLPESVAEEAAALERTYFSFITELALVSNRHGLALRDIGGVWKFDPKFLVVQYDMDSSGVLTPKFVKAADEAVELP